MSATPTHDLCIKQGEYIDSNGEQKGRWLTIGTIFRHDDGGTSIKLDCVPIGNPDWNGWVSVFPRKPREGRGHGRGMDFQAPRQQSQGRHGQPSQDFNDDIHF